MIVDTCWGPKQIDEKPYWHFVPTRGTNAMLFYNNVSIGKGALLSVSAGIQAEPHLENAHTPYSLCRIDDRKERVYEKIRTEKYPTCPSRLKSVYLFDDPNLVERALNSWFRQEPKEVHECRLLAGAVTHKADTTWLNCHEDEWVNCANKYWSGLMSNDAFPEMIVHGAIYFPNYKEFPKPSDFYDKNA